MNSCTDKADTPTVRSAKISGGDNSIIAVLRMCAENGKGKGEEKSECENVADHLVVALAEWLLLERLLLKGVVVMYFYAVVVVLEEIEVIYHISLQ